MKGQNTEKKGSVEHQGVAGQELRNAAGFRNFDITHVLRDGFHFLTVTSLRNHLGWFTKVLNQPPVVQSCAEKRRGNFSARL